MTSEDVYAYLFSLRRFGVKWGLGPMARVMRHLGSPQENFSCVHVAGTNGKGSVSSMTQAVLCAHGLSCGLYTSPHLERFNERIRIGAREIADEDVAKWVERIKKTGVPLSFFEMATAVAFLHFAHHRVDVAVVEVGLGGRLDATQWMRPCAGAVVSLGADHALALTADPLRVAWEKASIAAPGVPFVLPATLPAPLLQVVRNTIAARGAVPVECGRDWHFSVPAPQTLRWRFANEPELEVRVPLAGSHQAGNCAMALTLARLALGRPLEAENPFDGFFWPGRFECIDGVYIDGGHNPPALARLVQTVREMGLAPLPVLTGFMADKDVLSSLRILGEIASAFICTQVDAGERVLPAEKLADLVREAGLPLAACEPDLARALAIAPRPLLAAGSFYLAGQVRSMLRNARPPVHTRLSDPPAR